MADVTDLYLQAQALRAAGERVVSTDEMTGIQALERKHPTIPMGPGRAERREFEYIRRGPLTLIANCDVAQGTIVTPSLGPTRTEEDFLETIARTPGCPQQTFIVECGSSPLSQEGNPMFGPGAYRPDPSAGITVPAALPQPASVPERRTALRPPCPRCGHAASRDKQSQRTLPDLGHRDGWCPRDLRVPDAQHSGTKGRPSLHAARCARAPPGRHETPRGSALAVRSVGEAGGPARPARGHLGRDHRVCGPGATLHNGGEAGGKKGAGAPGHGVPGLGLGGCFGGCRRRCTRGRARRYARRGRSAR